MHGAVHVASKARKYFCDKFENTWVNSRVVRVKAQEERCRVQESDLRFYITFHSQGFIL